VFQRWETGRVEAFSDGVFAIAITLLVLDLEMPEDAYGDLWQGFADLWPSYLAYVTSFLAIGAVWLEHHRLFTCLRLADTHLIRLNLALLLVVSFLPFPTGVMADAVTLGRHTERPAVVVYGATLLGVTLLLAALWRYVDAHRELLHEEAAPGLARELARHRLPRLGVLAIPVVAGILLFPRAAVLAYLLVAVDAVARARGDRNVVGQ